MMENHPSQFDGEQFWNALEPKLPRRKRRPVVLWILLSGLVISSLIYTLYLKHDLDLPIQGETQENTLEEALNISSSQVEQTQLDVELIEHSAGELANLPSSPTLNASTTETTKTNSITRSVSGDPIISNLKTAPLPVSVSTELQTVASETKSKLRTGELTTPLMTTDPTCEINRFKNDHPLLKLDDPLLRIQTKLPWKWDAELSSGIFHVRYKRETRSDQAEDVIALEKKTESPILSYAFQGLIRGSAPSGWGLDAGIGKMIFLNRFDYTSSSSVTSEMITTRTISTPNGDTTLTIKDYETEITRREVSQLIKQSYLNIPLGVFYQKNHKLWSFGVRAGLRLHILESSEGAYLRSNAVEFWSEKETSPFRTDAWLSYNMGIRIQRRLWERVALTINPSVEWTSSNILKNDYNTQRRFTLVGINCGLTYYLH